MLTSSSHIARRFNLDHIKLDNSSTCYNCTLSGARHLTIYRLSIRYHTVQFLHGIDLLFGSVITFLMGDHLLPIGSFSSAANLLPCSSLPLSSVQFCKMKIEEFTWCVYMHLSCTVFVLLACPLPPIDSWYDAVVTNIFYSREGLGSALWYINHSMRCDAPITPCDVMHQSLLAMWCTNHSILSLSLAFCKNYSSYAIGDAVILVIASL